ncbi:unnamed protein product, partial [Protopolystoma xenopodis]
FSYRDCLRRLIRFHLRTSPNAPHQSSELLFSGQHELESFMTLPSRIPCISLILDLIRGALIPLLMKKLASANEDGECNRGSPSMGPKENTEAGYRSLTLQTASLYCRELVDAVNR